MYRSRSELTSIPCPTSNCGVRASASPGETMRAKTTAQTTAIKRGFDGFPAARENSTSVGTWAISRIIPTGYRLDLLRTTHHAVVQRLPRNRDLFCVSRRSCSSWEASFGSSCYPLRGLRANPWASGHSWDWTATRRPKKSCSVSQKRFLNPMQGFVRSEPLDRGDRCIGAIADHDEAGTHECSIEHDRARSTLTLFARVLGTSQTQFVSQHREEAFPTGRCRGVLSSIYREGCHCARHLSRRRRAKTPAA